MRYHLVGYVYDCFIIYLFQLRWFVFSCHKSEFDIDFGFNVYFDREESIIGRKKSGDIQCLILAFLFDDNKLNEKLSDLFSA